jgi:Streptomyces sporulation and cell division protein, SsgA
VVTDLTYDTGDPFAVTLVFRATPRPVRWTFARSLLTAGLTDPTGDGDVHVWPSLDDAGAAVVMVELCSPDGDVLVQLRTPDVAAFLDGTEAVVATGTEAEHLDLDAVIAAVLTDAL